MMLISGINLRTKSRLRVSAVVQRVRNRILGRIRTHRHRARFYSVVISRGACAFTIAHPCVSISPRAHVYAHTLGPNAVERGSTCVLYKYAYVCMRVVEYKSHSRSRSGGNDERTRDVERRVGRREIGGGRRKRWRRRRNGWRRCGLSPSLVSTLRIPNLGHTDTNAISVSVGESPKGRAGEEEETSRGIRAGVVRKLRICRLRRSVSANARSSPNPRAITPDFVPLE